MKNDENWENLKRGSRNALKTLFYSYHHELYRYGIKFCGDRQLVEDQIQNLFLKIWVQKENLADVKGVKTYLWTALRRDLIASMAKERRSKMGQNLSDDLFYLGSEDFMIENEKRELQRRELKKAIESLSARQREILYLRFYEGMSYSEIEEIMSIEYQVARNYISKSLRKLRTILQ